VVGSTGVHPQAKTRAYNHFAINAAKETIKAPQMSTLGACISPFDQPCFHREHIRGIDFVNKLLIS